jgi:CD63 antigen
MAKGRLNCGMKLIRNLMFVVNIAFILFAFLMIGYGAYAYHSKSIKLDTIELGVGIIVLGVFVLIVSFFGCLGAFWESRCLLGFYGIILVIIIICQISIGFAAVALKGKIAEKLEVNKKKNLLQKKFINQSSSF